MAWHEDLSLEIVVEFIGLSGTAWSRTEDCLWIRRQAEHVAWAEHGSWWRKTVVGKRYQSAYSKSRRRRLKKVVVAVRACVSCGKAFELTAARREHGRDRTCSAPECRGGLRRNIEMVTIDGESMPLVRWAKRYGVSLGTVWARRKRGWDLRTALTHHVRRGPAQDPELRRDRTS